MHIKRIEQPAAEAFAHRVASDVEHPDPRKRAKCDFERAGPIDPVTVRVRAPPAFELRFDLAQKLWPPGEPPRLRQQYEMLVAVELPDYFVIAHPLEIEIRHPAEIIYAARFPAAVIASPINFRTGFDLISHQRETMGQNALRQAAQLCRVWRANQARGYQRGIGQFRERRFYTAIDVRRLNKTEQIPAFLPQAERYFLRATHGLKFSAGVAGSSKLRCQSSSMSSP